MHNLIRSHPVAGAAAAAGFILTRRPGCGAEILLPGTGPVTVLAAKPFGTFGAWTALATPANDTFLTRLQARRFGVGTAGEDMLVEFGQGAGTSPVDALRSHVTIVDPNAEDTGFPALDLNTYNTLTPAGAELQARVSENGGGVKYQVWACGWDSAVPAFTALNVARPTGAGRYYPSNTSAGLNPIPALLPAYGAWVTVIDPAPNDLLVTAVTQAESLSNQGAIGTAYQLGIGAAGSEVACGTFLAGHCEQATNCDPPLWVKAGERLAVRASSTAVAGRLCIVKVLDL